MMIEAEVLTSNNEPCHAVQTLGRCGSQRREAVARRHLAECFTRRSGEIDLSISRCESLVDRLIAKVVFSLWWFLDMLR